MSARVAHWRIAHHLFELLVERGVAGVGCGGFGHQLFGGGMRVDAGIFEAFAGRIFDGGCFLDRFDLGEIVTLQVLDAEHAENVVDDRGRELDVRVARHRSVRLETRERELFDVGREWHAVLQPDGHGHRKAVHQ